MGLFKKNGFTRGLTAIGLFASIMAGCTVETPTDASTETETQKSNLGIPDKLQNLILRKQRVPYSSERVCRETCGMTKVDLSVKDLIVDPGNVAHRTYPRDYLDTPYEVSESRRRTAQNSALKAINLDGKYGAEVPITAKFYLEAFGDEADNKWQILRTKQFKNYAGPYVSDLMKERVLKVLVELNHIKIIDTTEDELTNSVSITTANLPYMERRQIYGKNTLVFTIPLFDIKNVTENNLLYFSSQNITGYCENPNAYFLREIVPKSDVARRMINARYDNPIISGSFTSCIWIKEWTASTSLPVLRDFNINY